MAWRGGESSAADDALSCWYRYSVAVISLYVVYSVVALKIRWHSEGRCPVKDGPEMLQVSREGLGASVLLRMVVGVCCSNA